MEKISKGATYTICNHHYCSTCIVKFIRTIRINNSRQVPCPCCRRSLSLIVIADKSGISNDELEYIKAYNASFSEERDLIDSLINAAVLLKAFYRETVRTKGFNMLQNWHLNVLLAISTQYYLITLFLAVSGVTDCKHSVFSFKNSFYLLIFSIGCVISHTWSIINDNRGLQHAAGQ